MNHRSTLSDTDVARIKSRLWLGGDPTLIAEERKISAVSVRFILTGRRWAHVKWPDGSTGAMAEARREKIEAARREVGREGSERAVAKLMTKGERG